MSLLRVSKNRGKAIGVVRNGENPTARSVQRVLGFKFDFTYPPAFRDYVYLRRSAPRGPAASRQLNLFARIDCSRTNPSAQRPARVCACILVVNPKTFDGRTKRTSGRAATKRQTRSLARPDVKRRNPAAIANARRSHAKGDRQSNGTV